MDLGTVEGREACTDTSLLSAIDRDQELTSQAASQPVPHVEGDSVTAETEPFQKKERINQMLRAACEVLVDRTDGVGGGDVIDKVKLAVPPTEVELTRNDSGRIRYDTNLRFWSIDLVKAGWIRKDSGRWFLTDAGQSALEEYPDAQEFGRAANKLYKAWKKQDAEEKEGACRLGADGCSRGTYSGGAMGNLLGPG